MRVCIITLVALFLLACDDDDLKVELLCCTDSGDEIVCLNADTDTLIADGNALVTLTACIPTNAAKDIRNITFKAPADAGIFPGEATATQAQREVDDNKTAQALFRVGTIPGSYRMTVEVSNDNVTYMDELYLVLGKASDEKITVSYDRELATLVADNTQLFEANVKVTGLDLSQRMVNVSLSGPIEFAADGMTTNKDITVDENGEARMLFKVGDEPGNTIIQYSTSGALSETSIFELLPAYPQEIALVPQKQSIGVVNDSLHIDIYLIRSEGQVSKGIPINLSAFQWLNNGREEYTGFIPPFLFTRSVEPGMVNAKATFVSPSDSIFVLDEPMNLEISIPTDDGGVLRDTAVIQVK